MSWRPDPSNSDAYPCTEKTSTAQWKWEFLRRNEHYQKEYAELANLIELEASQHGELLCMPGVIPPADWGFKPATAELFCRLKHYSVDWYECSGVLPDPSENWPVSIKFFEHRIEAVSLLDFKNCDIDSLAVHASDKSDAVILFDVSRTLTDQLKEAKAKLKSLAEKYKQELQSKPRTKSYALFLRISDAVAANQEITNKELGKIVFPGKEINNAEDHIEKLKPNAMNLIDGGYARL